MRRTRAKRGRNGDDENPLEVLARIGEQEQQPDLEYHAEEQGEKAVIPTYTVKPPGQFFIKPSPVHPPKPEPRGGARARSKGAG